jgi:hypothetical protein
MLEGEVRNGMRDSRMLDYSAGSISSFDSVFDTAARTASRFEPCPLGNFSAKNRAERRDTISCRSLNVFRITNLRREVLKCQPYFR